VACLYQSHIVYRSKSVAYRVPPLGKTILYVHIIAQARPHRRPLGIRARADVQELGQARDAVPEVGRPPLVSGAAARIHVARRWSVVDIRVNIAFAFGAVDNRANIAFGITFAFGIVENRAPSRPRMSRAGSEPFAYSVSAKKIEIGSEREIER
jgi:hypothetical protein